MDAVMGYGEMRRQGSYPEPCGVPPYRHPEPSVRAVHTSHFSPYKPLVSDKHRHKRTYTSMGAAGERSVYAQNGLEDTKGGELSSEKRQGSAEDVSTVGWRSDSPSSNTLVEEGFDQWEMHRCHSAPSTPFRPFKDENRTDEYYRRYLQLSGNMAYRYPEPGYPRERQGAMGGTWRHIKEVLGYGGSQVCFVDGLVRLYDHDTKALSSPSKQLPHMRTSMGTPAYAPNRHNVSSYKRTLQQELEKSTYKPWVDPTKQQMPSIYEAPRGSQMATTGQSGKYKGFYSYPSN